MRLTELRLPLDHSDADLRAAIVKRLGIATDELFGYSVFRRGHDARKRSAVFLTYTLDVTLRDEPAVLARLADDDHVGPTPDTAYRFIARAPSPPPTPRPVVIGTGPCGLLVNQLLCGANLLAVVEAFQVAEKLGMDRSLVVEACGNGAAGSWQLLNLGPKIITQDHRPGCRAEHLLKDLKFLRYALASSPAQANPPCFDLALAAFEEVSRIGKGELGTQTVWMTHPAKNKAA